MAFSPFARFRNFTLDNLKLLLEVYPDMADTMSWSEASNMIENSVSGYKKTAYQQACQFGIEDRGRDRFRIQNYLYTFDDENLKKYLQFWIKLYYAPNPFVKSDEDEPFLIYCEMVKEIVKRENFSIRYYDFFNRRIGGKSDDILLNALKAYASPIKHKKVNNEDIIYIEQPNVQSAINEVKFIEENLPIGDSKSRTEFFDRFSYQNYCKFWGITNNLPTAIMFENKNTMVKRKTGAANTLFYGVPGAGKSHAIKQKCSDMTKLERVVFHPDYTYSDFVGQILPRVVKDKENPQGRLRYIFTPGPFTKMLKKAEEDPSNMYYLVIEEINRGNAPAIFGEIFQLLDRIEDGSGEYAISNYDVAEWVYGDENHEVRMPSNMSLLATMNTSDQNVFTLDTAFQRRWNMKHIPNKVMKALHADIRIDGTDVSWGVFASVINDELLQISTEMSSLEDKRLGAYFIHQNELAFDKFPEKALKYLWDDAFKMEKDKIFNESMKSLEEVISTYQSAKTDRLKVVLRHEVYKKMIKQMTEKKFIKESLSDTLVSLKNAVQDTNEEKE